MLKTILRSKFTYCLLFFYLIIVGWWIKLQYKGLGTTEAYIFNWLYSFIAFAGAINGIRIAFKRWGGWKSVIGKGLIFLSLGLIGQGFGLQIWTFYNVVLKVEVPYPSFADIGYFTLIPAYIIASIMFAHASGAKFSLRTIRGKLYAVLIPVFALTMAYSLFLKDIGFDLSNPFKLFLDFGYPLGEIIPVSIALFTLTLSGRLLGGTMKNRILFLIFAFFFQFVTEYIFLYTAAAGTFIINAGLSDIMYASSYALMGIGLIAFADYK